MTPADRKSFLETIVGFAELKGRQLSAPAIELYWRSLQHWDVADFRVAAEHLLRTCEFMPMPKDFEDLRKAGRPTSGEAWIKALKFARTGYVTWIGGGAPTRMGEATEPDDPLIARAVEAIGGYQAIAMSPTDKTHFLEKRFCEHFEAIQNAEEIREAVPQIALAGPVPVAGILERFHNPAGATDNTESQTDERSVAVRATG